MTFCHNIVARILIGLSLMCAASLPGVAETNSPQLQCSSEWKEQQLLGDYLRVLTPPEAVVEERQFRSLMGTMPEETAITRIRIPIAGTEIVLQAQSLWALAPKDMSAAIASTQYLVKLEGKKKQEVLDLGGGWRAVAVFPERYNYWKDSYLLGYSWVRSPNGLLYQLLLASWIEADKYPELAATAACIVSSLKPGMFFPEIPIGETRLDSQFVLPSEDMELVISFDGKHVFTTETGVDYVVFRVLSLVEIGSGAGEMGIYVGMHPGFNAADELSKGGKSKQDQEPILGKLPTWIVRDEGELRRQSTLFELRSGPLPWMCHIFISGTPEQVDTMVSLARTLKFRRKS